MKKRNIAFFDIALVKEADKEFRRRDSKYRAMYRRKM